MSAALEIQKAVYSALTADITLMGKITGVFDEVPPGQALPYVVLGDTTEVPESDFVKKGYENTITLHIWSEYPGFKEAKEILADLNRILDRAILSITGFNTVYCKYDFSETLETSDGKYRHIPVRYRILVKEV